MNQPKLSDKFFLSARTRILVCLFVVTIYTFAAKFYRGPGQDFMNNWGPASVGYVVFFMLGILFFVPRRKAILPVALAVLVATCLLEFAQRWQPNWLQAVRQTFLGKALLGSSFSWYDFPAYFIGALIGTILLHFLLRAKRSELVEG